MKEKKKREKRFVTQTKKQKVIHNRNPFIIRMFIICAPLIMIRQDTENVQRKLFLKCYVFFKRKRSECIVSTFLPSTCSASYEVIGARHNFFLCPLQILQDL